MGSDIENLLNTKLFKNTGTSSRGCISSGDVYETDNGKVFVKKNHKDGADIMFNGEYQGLKALQRTGFNVPTPLLCGKNYLVMEYIDMKSLRKYSEDLGRALALLHKGVEENHSRVGATKWNEDKFGFSCATCCGFLPLNNDWQNDWLLFFTTQRLEPLINKLQTEYGDRDLVQLWSQLQLVIPNYFKNIKVTPSLLHGDLWSGNAGETDRAPVTFDPAVFFGHDEFDLAIAHMFGGFSKKFFDAYHAVLPKRQGIRARLDLYQLFHNLNHWCHFGVGYRASSLSRMSSLVDGRYLET